jgi:hypothetical protein
MQRSSMGGDSSTSAQPVHLPKRAWTDPSIVDEDVSNTANGGKAGGAETPTTNGPAS